jgi:hypothetical protein
MTGSKKEEDKAKTAGSSSSVDPNSRSGGNRDESSGSGSESEGPDAPPGREKPGSGFWDVALIDTVGDIIFW